MIDEQDKPIYFPMSFNEQMAQIATEIDRIITNGSKSKISEMGKAAYGEPGCACSIKLLFETIKADPENEAVNLYDAKKSSAFWERNKIYVRQVQQL